MDLIFLRICLPLMAIIVSANTPLPLMFVLGKGSLALKVTTLRLAINAAYVTWVYSFFRHQARWLLPAGAVTELQTLYGPSLTQIETWTTRMSPQSTAAWGVIAVTAAFVFLGLGVAVSLRKSPPLEQETST